VYTPQGLVHAGLPAGLPRLLQQQAVLGSSMVQQVQSHLMYGECYAY
jgi:hypothetical protein